MPSAGRLSFGAGLVLGSLTGAAISTVTYKRRLHVEYEEITPAAVRESRGQEILQYGKPRRDPWVVYYTNHALGYDRQKRIPIWVAEHLTQDNLKGPANRRFSKFQPDPAIHPMFSAQHADYKGSGYSRGHMAPAGDNKTTQTAMDDTHLYSNILPQNFENNAGFWNRLEMYCRELTQTFRHVRIISGPAFVAQPPGDDGKTYVKYEVIGGSQVAVPTHLYKVILVEKEDGKPFALGSFLIPHKPISWSHQLPEFHIPIEKLESITGISFLEKLENKTSLPKLCDVDECKLIGYKEFELWLIGRKLDGARTDNRLEKVWGELKQKKLKPDQYLIDLYESKKKELELKENEILYRKED